MFKTFGVAGLAAATALLCASPAAAQSLPVDPSVQAAEAAPVTPAVTRAPAEFSVGAPALALPPIVEAASAPVVPAVLEAVPAPVTSSAPITGRVRPDRAETVIAAPPASPTPVPATPAVISGARRSLADLVADHAGEVEPTDEQFECLASAVYFESRGEPLDGQLAVAEVIINRVASGRFRSTICDVVKQPSQFSFVRRGVIPAAPRHSEAWQRAVAIAHIALNNLHDVTGDNSLFFHATYVRPAWGRASARIARIGNHIFYR